ncbi:hypothetical protein COU74_01350 [Candidatus Peregrinibacteria bacterium CG10_big_fil_rev_8_21_14_0_10_36_19]|nr:MAG: hypothetical protein COU74_01350 [Candidatus Peregrinibacteria bacterium CG10_big_fil_rev_8_21_14_0_10_36_19]
MSNESISKKAKKGQLSTQELIQIEKGVKRAEALATVLDTGMVDPLLGLFEGGGDIAAALAGAYIIDQAKKADISYWELSKMLGRQTLDLTGGSIPIVGDIFDFAYKSNKKNAEALRKHFEKIRKTTIKAQEKNRTKLKSQAERERIKN